MEKQEIKIGDIDDSKAGDYEITYEWATMSTAQRHMTIAGHVDAFKKAGIKCSPEKMERLFELGKPKVVIGVAAGKPILRIHTDSVEVMKVIIESYI